MAGNHREEMLVPFFTEYQANIPFNCIYQTLISVKAMILGADRCSKFLFYL